MFKAFKTFLLPKPSVLSYKYKSGLNFRAHLNFYCRHLCEENPNLNPTVISEPTTVSANPFQSTDAALEAVKKMPLPTFDADESAFELGLWLSGLESFLNIQNQSFIVENHSKSGHRDWTKEFRLTHSTLLRCSGLTFQIARAINKKENDLEEGVNIFGISTEELQKLSKTLKESVLLSQGLLRAEPVHFREWTAWSNALSAKLKESEAFVKFIKFAEKSGETFYPEIMQNLLAGRDVAADLKADLDIVLPRIAKILKWLSVVRRLIRQDKPLKPAILIYARVYEQIRDLTSYINNRLLRYPDKESEFFGTLDGAAYVASIELRKVYQSELTGLSDIRPVPLVRAKIEASFGLLNDSFQQTLVSFAQLIAPEIKAEEIFPEYQVKREQSILLRQDLWEMMNEVQKAEQTPETYPLDELKKRLSDFTHSTMHYLIYKDWETVERFVEELVRTDDKKDLVPLLHRFGAYLETLFGQINMRGVLADHPFEPK